jgi:hypothetical protein
VPLGTRDLQWFPGTPKLIYVVDGARMERSQDYPEIVRTVHRRVDGHRDVLVLVLLLNTS